MLKQEEEEEKTPTLQQGCHGTARVAPSPLKSSPRPVGEIRASARKGRRGRRYLLCCTVDVPKYPKIEIHRK